MRMSRQRRAQMDASAEKFFALRREIAEQQGRLRPQRNGPSFEQCIADTTKQRREILKQLGFVSYKAYLKSDLWWGIRTAYLARHPDCFLCPAQAAQIHHASYTLGNLSGRECTQLFSLCADCHQRIEFTPSGQKVPLWHANRWLFKLRKRYNQAMASASG